MTVVCGAPGSQLIDSKPIDSQHDPLGYDIELPLRKEYLPMGFPLQLATNSEIIPGIADRLWSRWVLRRASKPVALRVIVDEKDSAPVPAPALCYGHEHLVSIVQNAENFAVCDVSQGFAWIRVTRNTARDAAWLSYYFLEPVAFLLIDAAHLAPLHASSIALGEKTIIICGESGSGKTSLAYYCCSRRGWSYLSGDATHIVRATERPIVVGRPHTIRFRESARELFPELNDFLPQSRPNGRPDIEIGTADLDMPVREEGIVRSVVFLDRRQDAGPARLAVCPGSEAMQRFQQLVCYGDERIRQEQRSALERLTRVPVFHLTWSDFRSAENVLRDLAA